MNENDQGQLFVCVKETRRLRTKGVGAFCIFQLEKQQVQTRGVLRSNNSEFSYDAWDEGYTFDITSSASVLVISVWSTQKTILSGDQVDNRDVSNLGQLSIPLIALLHQKPIDQWFKLTSYDSTESTGEIHLKIQYTSISKKIGIEDFRLLKVVGKGSFAKVMLVRKADTGRLYAMKIISKDAVIKHNAVKHTISEKNVLKRINHPYIVSLKYSFQTEDKLYMILDYICGGELFYHLSEAEKFSEDRARFYAAEIILALGYLHKMNIVYRDLKPENILLDMHGHICLTDFGLCKEGLGFGHLTHTFCGSPEYLAPEIFLGSGYSYSVDWWALGTLLYEMLSGLPPFFSDDIDEMNERILGETLTFPSYFSANAKSILSKLLDRNPTTRLGSGSSDSEEIKQHPFFKSINWSKLEKRQIEPPFRPYLRSETDVRFFDPDSTQMVAQHSFHETYLSSKEQEAFKNFSYVAPDADTFNTRSRSLRRRGSSSGSSRGSTSTEGSPTSSHTLSREKPLKDFLLNRKDANSTVQSASALLANLSLDEDSAPSEDDIHSLSSSSSTSSNRNRYDMSRKSIDEDEAMAIKSPKSQPIGVPTASKANAIRK